MAIYLFPLWALIVSIFAYLFPQWLVELKSIIVPLLVLVMLAMGLTLKWRDFTEVLAYRHIVATGVAIQFVVMPFAAWLIEGSRARRRWRRSPRPEGRRRTASAPPAF